MITDTSLARASSAGMTIPSAGAAPPSAAAVPPSVHGGVQINEDALVARAKEMDEGAWEILFDRYYDHLCGFLTYRLRNRSAAEDIASQVFVEAVAGIKRYEARGIPFKSWLFRIARNLSTDYMMRESRNGRLTIELSEDGDPSGLAEQRMQLAQVGRAMAHLPDEQRQVILLRFVNELSIAETAQVMKKSAGAIKALQHRALAAARRILASTDPEIMEQSHG